MRITRNEYFTRGSYGNFIISNTYRRGAFRYYSKMFLAKRSIICFVYYLLLPGIRVWDTRRLVEKKIFHKCLGIF